MLTEQLKVKKDNWFYNLKQWRMFTLENMNTELDAIPDRKTRYLWTFYTIKHAITLEKGFFYNRSQRNKCPKKLKIDFSSNFLLPQLKK